jgi:hypothetical protein
MDNSHSKDEYNHRSSSGRIVPIPSRIINNKPKMGGCHSQTYFLVHCYHSGNFTSSLDMNSDKLGKVEKRKKLKRRNG